MEKPAFGRIPQTVAEMPVGQDGQEREREHERMIREKLWAAWRFVFSITAKGTEKFGGVVNQQMTGEILYDAITHPDLVLENIKERFASTIGADENFTIPVEELRILTAPMADTALIAETLDKKEFVDAYCHAMTNEVDFRKAYFPGADHEIKKMLQSGPVRIWTTGDVFGVPSLELRGHYEQLKRLVKGGFADLRREEFERKLSDAYTRSGDDVSDEQKRTIRRDIKENLDFDVVAHEDKVKQLRSVTESFHEKGVTHIAVIDDKVGNLLNARDRIIGLYPDMAGKIVLVWDRQSEKDGPSSDGRGKLPGNFTGTPEEAIAQYGLTVIDDISHASDAVRGAIGGGKDVKIGWIVDHDDVISEDNVRTELQSRAVIDLFRAHEVIKKAA